MYVLAPLNEKGGDGKTTVALTIAAGLAARGMRVVMIDADPNSGLTPSVNVKQKGAMYDLLVRDAPWFDLLVEIKPERYAPASGSKGALYLLPGNNETENIASTVLNPYLFGARLKELAYQVDEVGELVRDAQGQPKPLIDVVVVDVSPTAKMLHGSVYMAADGVIYTAQPNFLSLNGLSKTLKHTGEANELRTAEELAALKIIGIQPTLYKSRTLIHGEYIRKYREQYGRRIVWPAIPDSIIWQEASAAQRSIFAYVKQEVNPDTIDADYDPTEDEERTVLKIAWSLVRRVERSMAEHG